MKLQEYLNKLRTAFITNLSLELSKEGIVMTLEESVKVIDTIERDIIKEAKKEGVRLNLMEVSPIKARDNTFFFFIQDGIKRLKISISLVSGDKSPHYRVKCMHYGNGR